MRTKKVRGLKRKTKKMLERIEYNTIVFPTDFYGGYWEMKLPVGGFINSKKTPMGIKRLCINKLLERAQHLVAIKPQTKETYRVVILINATALWNSEIIVFKGDTYFQSFFDRNDGYQKWTTLQGEGDIAIDYHLSIPSFFDIKRFKQEIEDEDGSFENELWFIGEIY